MRLTEGRVQLNPTDLSSFLACRHKTALDAAVANKAIAQMRVLLVEFGMTPSSRTRVAAAAEDDEDGMLDA